MNSDFGNPTEQLRAAQLNQQAYRNPTEAEAAEKLLNRAAREFANAYDAGEDPEMLAKLNSAYTWLKCVAQEDQA